MALFAWVFKAAAVAVPTGQVWAYKRRDQTKESLSDQMSDVAKLLPANTL